MKILFDKYVKICMVEMFCLAEEKVNLALNALSFIDKRYMEMLQLEKPSGKGGGGEIVNIIFTVKNINTSCIPRSM